MYVSARERLILETLLSNDEEMTVKQLAERLDVSERTIHRDLKGFNRILKDYHLTLLKKSGVGIRVIGDKKDIEALRLSLMGKLSNEYTPEERQTVILCSLLEAREPMKLAVLANDLNVTIATISHDLTKLEGLLHQYGLDLLRKRGYGVELVGSETAKRKAMSDLIAKNLDESEFLSLVKRNIQNKSQSDTDPISTKLLGLVEKEKLVVVEKIIEEINSELDYFIADSAYIGLVVHLALAVERIQKGESITIDSAFLQGLQTTPEYRLAEKIIPRLEQVFEIDIPEAEIGYITMHLHGAKLRYENEYMNDPAQIEISDKAMQLIQYVGAKVHVDLTNDYSLFQGLVTHLTPALFRVQQQMRIYNPLLDKIKEDYTFLFEVVKAGVNEVFSELDIPDEEVGFIVLHLGSSLMNYKKIGTLNALVICSSGIGTSKILSSRLKQEIPEIQHLKNASLFELRHLDVSDYDLVISTIKIPDFSGDYIFVSPFLTQNEVKRIREKIQFKNSAGLEKVRSPAQRVTGNVSLEHLLGYFTDIHRYSATILSILNHFSVWPLDAAGSIETGLRTLCEQCEKDGSIMDADTVIKDLLEREKIGGLGIPGTRLSLYHARSEQILKPVFTLGTLREPILVKGMDQSDVEVEVVLLMLAPEKADRQELEILSFISSLIIESKESVAVFETHNREKIATFLVARFDRLLFEKIQEKRNR